MFHSILQLISHNFWGIIDLLWIMFAWRTRTTLSRAADERSRRHLHWVTPMLIGSLLQLPYRVVENIRYFSGQRWPSLMDSLDVVLMVGAVFEVIALYRLFYMLRGEVQPASLVTQAVEVWDLSYGASPVGNEMSRSTPIKRRSRR